MIYEWDEAKRASNLIKHGLDFDLVRAFNWDTAIIQEDARRDYGERRWVAIGQMGERVVVVVYTYRDGMTRLISARGASNKEILYHETAHHPQHA